MAQRIIGRQTFVQGLKVVDGENIYLGDINDVLLAQYNSGDYLIGPNPTSGFWADCPALAFSDPQYATVFKEDFHLFDSRSGGAWNRKTNGSGTATLADASTSGVGIGGVLQLYGSSSGGYAWVQGGNQGGTGGTFKLTNGKKLWCQARVSISKATGENVMVGLMCPVAALDIMSSDKSIACSAGIYFAVIDTSGSLVQSCTRNSNAETIIQASATTHSGGWVTLGWKYDGAGTLTPYVGDTAKTTAVSGGAGVPTDIALAPTFSMVVGDVKDATRNTWVDWIQIVAER